VRFFHYLALLVFFADLPVPLYWFILHPFSRFWRALVRPAFYFAGFGSWSLGAFFVIHFRNKLLAAGAPSGFAAFVGATLILADGYVLYRAGKDLGHGKLVGRAELTGKTELVATGIYRHIRHPRYAGMIASVAGACLLAGSNWAVEISVIWFALVMDMIFLEEREMRARFGPEYDSYSRDVPGFFPRILHH